MYLRAEGVSIEFPLAPSLHRNIAASSQASQLGGHIQVRGRKAFVSALEDVSIDLGSGDRLALIGHNGSGKSTLLRALAGIYHPTRGTIASSGNVSGIFNMSLGFRLEASGYRNLVLKGLMAGRSRAQVDALLPSIAEFTGLGPYLDMPLRSYSQGMAMRLAFAATTALSDDILVMDEWIGAGDASFQEQIVVRMQEVVNASRIIVIASHSTALLRRIADQAIWLEHGRIRKAGEIGAVIDEYEQSIVPSGLSEQQITTLRSGHGLWLSAPGDPGFPTTHLVWNLQQNTAGVQLFVCAPDGTRNAIRPCVQRMGAWPLAQWALPGMHFELAIANCDDSVAHFMIPDSGALILAN